MNHGDDLFEGTVVIPFDKSHKVFDFFFFRFVDDELVGLLHEVVELLGEVGVSQENVIDLDVAVVIIIVLLIFSERFGEFFVGLRILGFQFF